ncbi:MAG TPA: hypothetical protein DCP28_18985 [Cytophagales bacterium]|nr:hypothetical protein [Cytophagales bacterium]
MAQNRAGRGGGISWRFSGALRVYNSIATQNSAPEDPHFGGRGSEYGYLGGEGSFIGNFPTGGFTNADAQDFSLQPSSIAIDAADASFANGIAADIAGEYRTMGPAPDAGAWEYSTPLYLGFDDCNSPTLQASPYSLRSSRLHHGTGREGGHQGGGVYFDGIDDYIQGDISNRLVSGTTFSVAFWINPDDLRGKQWILGSTVGPQEEVPFLRLKDQQLEMVLAGEEEPTKYAVGQSLQTGTWQHVAFTYDHGTLRGYLNGTPTATYSWLQNITGGRLNPAITLGRSASGMQKNGAYAGYLDELYLTPEVLSEQEISALAGVRYQPSNCAIGGLDLAGSWALDDCGETSINNDVPTSPLGEAMGAEGAEGYRGTGFAFDGKDDVIRLHDSTWTTGPHDALTYSLWVYPTRTNARRETLLCRQTSGSSVLIGLDRGHPSVLMGGTQPQEYWISPKALTPHTWHHIAVSYQQGWVTLYINGERTLHRKDIKGALNFGAGYHQLGLRWDDTRAFRGRLDEVQVFRTSLNDAEIRRLYVTTLAAPASCLSSITAQRKSATGAAVEMGPNLRVYPNPTTGLFTVQYDGPLAVQVMDVQGRLQQTKQGMQKVTLDLSQQPTGWYVVHIRYGDGSTIIRKILKK